MQCQREAENPVRSKALVLADFLDVVRDLSLEYLLALEAQLLAVLDSEEEIEEDTSD